MAPQLVGVLSGYRRWSSGTTPASWVFATGKATPLGHRNAKRRAMNSAADRAGLNDDGWPRLRFHDLRHTFASHLIIDLRLDVAQVSRILGHARVTTTLDVYTHMFDEARHTLDVRAQMAGSAFADLLERREEGGEEAGSVITLPRAQDDRGGRLSAKERAALRWAT